MYLPLLFCTQEKRRLLAMKLFSHPFAPYSRFIGYIEDIGESSLVFEGTHPQSIEKVAFCGKI